MLRRLFPLPIPLRALGVLLADFGLLWVARSAGLALWPGLHPDVPVPNQPWSIFALLALCLIGCGAVSPDGLRARADMLVRVMASLSLGAILLAIGHVMFPGFAGPVGAHMIMLLLALPMLCLSRLAFSHVADTPYFARRLFVLGTGDGHARVASIVAQRPGLRLLGHLEVESTEAELDGQLTRHILGQGVDEVILATACRQQWPVRALVPLRMAGVRVIDVSAFIEREIGRIDLRWARPAWLLRPQGFAVRHVGAVVKRSLDLVLALGLLFSLAPFLAVVMMAIRLESPGPALFWQERVGQFGQRFWLVKLRSMGVHAEADGQPRWAEADDPRVTRLGRWLRQLHIDELPQLWNILRGEMSFVGPRPERPEFVVQLEAEIPYYAERHSVRPGITGWAQINYPYAASLQDARAKLEFDLFYVKHAHFLLDILILLQTARVLIWRTGAR